ncbi:MAG: type I 3-dehydroquinate dehydratase [Desulfobacterales bacterium]|jgi:3-dehydroquinate dehydratase type I
MICIPIIAADTNEACRKIARANPLADLLEIRLDLMGSVDLPKIIQTAGKPVMATYRSKREGGDGAADPHTYIRHILAALQAGVDLVDVEMWLPVKWRQKVFEARSVSRLVISTHIQDHTPQQPELDQILRDGIATGADLVKIVTRAEQWSDNFRVLELIPRARSLDTPIIAFCMGPMGKTSRILSYLMGGYLTFASLETGEESADGQIPVTEMRDVLDLLMP